MNEKQAKENGLSFTGIYRRNKEEVKERLNKILKDGYKAVLCRVPDSPLSRGGVGVGYSVYAEQKYFDDIKANELRARIDKSFLIIQELKNKLDADIFQENNLINNHITWLKEHGYSI